MLRRKVYHVQVRTDLCWGGGLEGGHNFSLIKTVQMFELNPLFFAVLLSHKSTFRQPDLKKKNRTKFQSRAAWNSRAFIYANNAIGVGGGRVGGLTSISIQMT